MFHEIGLICAFFGAAGFLWTNVDPCWKKTSSDLNVHPYDVCYGLYKLCTITAGGEWICDVNLSGTPLDLGVTARTHFARSAAIIASILTAFGLLLGGFSADCCQVGGWSDEVKRKYRTITGWILILAALMPAGAAAWYTRDIVMERYWYKFTQTPGLQFTISRGVYISFGAALLNIIGGLCFTLLSDNGCCNTSPRDKETYRYEPPSTRKLKPTRKMEMDVEYV